MKAALLLFNKLIYVSSDEMADSLKFPTSHNSFSDELWELVKSFL